MRCTARPTATRSSSARCCATSSETGAIYQDDTGRWTAAADLEAMAMPDSVRLVIGSRVARLGEAASQVLPLAAVIGREFDLDLLARVTERTEDELLDLLDAAAAVALVREVADVPGPLLLRPRPHPAHPVPGPGRDPPGPGPPPGGRGHRGHRRGPPRSPGGRARPPLVQRHPTRQHRQGHQLRPPGGRGRAGGARPR